MYTFLYEVNALNKMGVQQAKNKQKKKKCYLSQFYTKHTHIHNQVEEGWGKYLLLFVAVHWMLVQILDMFIDVFTHFRPVLTRNLLIQIFEVPMV